MFWHHNEWPQRWDSHTLSLSSVILWPTSYLIFNVSPFYNLGRHCAFYIINITCYKHKFNIYMLAQHAASPKSNIECCIQKLLWSMKLSLLSTISLQVYVSTQIIIIKNHSLSELEIRSDLCVKFYLNTII